MDVAKSQQANEEDPEFVRQRRAAIDTLLTDQLSKTQRFASQDVIRGKNLANGFEQISQRTPAERPSTATASVVNKPTNMAATAAAIKANTRCKHLSIDGDDKFDVVDWVFFSSVPEWAKNQIADEPTEDDKRRPQSDRKQLSRRNLDDDDDDDDRPRRGGGFGRNRRGRGRRDDDGGEETRPSKDVTLFDFFGSKPKGKNFVGSSSMDQKFDFFSDDSKSSSNIKDSESRFKVDTRCIGIQHSMWIECCSSNSSHHQ